MARKGVTALDKNPVDVEAEMAALSSMMIGGAEVIAFAVQHVGYESKQWFSVPAHSAIYDEIVSDYEIGAPFNLIVFTGRLRDSNKLAAMGGAAIVTQIYNFVPSASAIGMFLDRLRDKRWLRSVIQSARKIAKGAMEHQNDVDLVLRETEDVLLALIGRHSRNGSRSVRQIVSDVIEKLDSVEGILGISTGFPKLDALIGGLAESAKIVIAGAISSGKSALAQTMANSLAVDRNISVAIFTFEMNENQVVQRLIQIRSGIPTRKIARKEAEMFEVQKYSTAAGEVASAPIHVVCERLDMIGIKARCLQLKPRVVIVDYLQIVPETRQKGENRTDQLDRMSSDTKQLAIALNNTVIELSQLTENNGALMTRGSKGIIADSDVLLAIEGEDDEDKENVPKSIRVAKQRDGARKPLSFIFEKAVTRFRQAK